MQLTRLKAVISTICLAAVAVHLFFPAVKIDGVTLGLIALALLPWFQPLLKSLELPGGLKIELQDVKDATDKIAPVAAAAAQMRTDAAPEPAGDTDNLSFMRKVTEQDPNLALVGLRIELEKLLVELAQSANIPAEDRRSAGQLLQNLTKKGVVPETVAAGLKQLITLGNDAAHGAHVTTGAAEWAVALAPQLLGTLRALRPSGSAAPTTQRGTVPKAEVLASFSTKQPCVVRFGTPFRSAPQLKIGFYGSGDRDLDSGSLRKTAFDEHGFAFEVTSLPNNHEVAIWSVKWEAIGRE